MVSPSLLPSGEPEYYLDHGLKQLPITDANPVAMDDAALSHGDGFQV